VHIIQIAITNYSVVWRWRRQKLFEYTAQLGDWYAAQRNFLDAGTIIYYLLYSLWDIDVVILLSQPGSGRNRLLAQSLLM
jgi:hypothetical protein